MQREDGPFVYHYEEQLGETGCGAEEAKEGEDEVDLEIDEDSDVPVEGPVNSCRVKSWPTILQDDNLLLGTQKPLYNHIDNDVM